MNIIKAGWTIVDHQPGVEVLKKIESAARLCYKSENQITEDSCFKMVEGLIKRKHFAMLEHASITCQFVTDRGVTHEMVRHRLASFAQESTRYCNYGKGKFGAETTIIRPAYLEGDSEKCVKGRAIVDRVAQTAEEGYMEMLDLGFTPQEARGVIS